MSRFLLFAAVACCLVLAVSARQGSLDPSTSPFEGATCAFQQWSGTCTAGACAGGSKFSGKCKGPAAVQCCIMDPAAAAAGTKGVPADPLNTVPKQQPYTIVPSGPSADTLVPASPAYKFPYSTARHIVSDFALQRIRLYDGNVLLREWKMSSGAKGIGFKENYPASPSGKFRISMKVGSKQPLGMIIEKLTPQGRIGKESDSHAHMQTRILVLEGLDKLNRNTRARSIYIHGTNREKGLGKMASHGCFRMGNKEVLELYDAVPTGTEYWAIPKNAWPTDAQAVQSDQLALAEAARNGPIPALAPTASSGGKPAAKAAAKPAYTVLGK